MKNFGKIYVIEHGTIGSIEKQIYVDVAITIDFFFPFGVANNFYVTKNGYSINNMDFVENYTIDELHGKIVFGKINHYYDENLKSLSNFIIEEIMTQEEYNDKY